MTSDPTSEAIRGRGFTEGLDVLLGSFGGHVGVVWRAKRAVGCEASEASGGGRGRAKRAAGGASERSELTAGGLAVAAEGSGLRVYIYILILNNLDFY